MQDLGFQIQQLGEGFPARPRACIVAVPVAGVTNIVLMVFHGGNTKSDMRQ